MQPAFFWSDGYATARKCSGRRVAQRCQTLFVRSISYLGCTIGREPRVHRVQHRSMKTRDETEPPMEDYNYVHPPLLDVLVALVFVVDGRHATRPHRRRYGMFGRYGPLLELHGVRPDVQKTGPERQEGVDRSPRAPKGTKPWTLAQPDVSGRDVSSRATDSASFRHRGPVTWSKVRANQRRGGSQHTGPAMTAPSLSWRHGGG